MRNLQEQVNPKWTGFFGGQSWTVWINWSSDLKNISWSLEQFFLAVGQNNFGNKIPFFTSHIFLDLLTRLKSEMVVSKGVLKGPNYLAKNPDLLHGRISLWKENFDS